jgi:serine/threonine-protein kinase
LTDAEADVRDPRVGAEVDRYTIVRLLGKGGMGAVYEARHAKLGRRVAIKFLLPELTARAEILRRFENEAVAAGGLEHPNLVAVIDLGRAADGSPYLVMEFLQGEDCARLVRRVGALPVARAVNIVLQACRGVALAHDAGIVHRDLKPENLFLTDVGDGGDQIKVLDFGIAKLRPVDGQAATRTGSTFGTTHYMSPEQARGAGDVDGRTDVWSLGVVLYELLSGRKPFDAEQPLNVVHQILNATPPPLATARPGLPRGLAAVVERALRKDADERFPSIRALASSLAPFAEPGAARADAPVGSTRPSPATTTDQSARRPGLGRSAGTALALVGAMGIVAISLLGARGKGTAPVPSAVALPTPPLPAPSATAAGPPATPATTLAVPTGGAAGGPAAAPAEAAATASEQSGQSEQLGQEGQGGVAHMLARRLHDEARRTRSATPPAAGPGPPSAAPARPTLKLDPNPY